MCPPRGEGYFALQSQLVVQSLQFILTRNEELISPYTAIVLTAHTEINHRGGVDSIVACDDER